MDAKDFLSGVYLDDRLFTKDELIKLMEDYHSYRREYKKQLRDKQIEDYAQALIYYKICSNLNNARKESKTWFDKTDTGLEEPLPCPHRIGAELFLYEGDSNLKENIQKK